MTGRTYSSDFPQFNLHKTDALAATVALTEATSERSKITAETGATALRNRMTTPRYSRARTAAGAQPAVIVISGQNRAGTEGVGGVMLTLTSTNNPRFTPRTVRSSMLGTYAFGNVPAGFTYTVTPSKMYYTFTPARRTFTNVSVNQTDQDFAGVRQTYSISGRAEVSTAQGLAGVTMTLTRSRSTGETPRTVTTDRYGYYVFPDVPVAGNYTLTASKKNYSFDLKSRSYSNLSEDQTHQDFIAQLNSYSISGNVLVKDVLVRLSGSATGTTLSDSGGHYSFPNLAPAGNYTVTVSKSHYTFASRSKIFTDLSGDQIADFAITASPPHVLEFDGLSKRVNYGKFWLPGVDLGHFFWEFWAMPGQAASGRYLLSDGHGGAHALLFGFYGSGSGYVIGGNIFDGSRSTAFASDEGPAINEWGHFAVGWDGKTIVTYFDGVPVGMAVWTGPRRTLGPTGGGGYLCIGGSTHQNLVGRIAQVRGYEGGNPLEDQSGQSPPLSTFTPQTIFDCNDSFWHNCSLLSSFIHPTRPVADLSGNNKVGKLGGNPPPEYVIDLTAPTASGASTSNLVSAAAETSPTPPPVPSGALVFDSFSRRNSIYAFGGAGGVGSTEGGSAGPQEWQYDNQVGQAAPFGILNARVVILANDSHAAWVSTGSSDANLDVRVDRHPGRWLAGISTGLVFRLQDANNFFFVYTTGATASTQRLYLASVINGLMTPIASAVEMPERWITLRVVTLSTGRIEVYANTTLVYSTSRDVLAHATKAGLWNRGPNQALANRWDNFKALKVP